MANERNGKLLIRVPSMPDKINVAAFRLMLEYIYTNRALTASVNETTLLDLIGLAHHFGLGELERDLSDHVARTLVRPDSVGRIYESSRSYALSQLAETCARFVDTQATKLFANQEWRQMLAELSAEALASLLARDTFCLIEMRVLDLVKDWHACRNASALSGVNRQLLAAVRLTAAGSDEANGRVRLEAMRSLRLGDRELRGIERKPAMVLDAYYREVIGVDERSARSEYRLAVVDERRPRSICVEIANPTPLNRVKINCDTLAARRNPVTLELQSMHDYEFETVVNFTQTFTGKWRVITFAADFVKLDTQKQSCE